jgi:flagella synthesis protein FlgN
MSKLPLITTLLEQQQAQLDALLLLLRQELAALAARQPEQLTEIGQQKLALLQNITDTDYSISQHPDLADAKSSSWFSEYLLPLEQRLAECKNQNDINQQALEQSQLTLERFKTELLSSRGKAGLTYTNKGKPAFDNKGKGIKA